MERHKTKELDVSMITESDGSPVNMAPSTYGDTNKESKTLLIKYQEDGIQKQENYTIDIINDVKTNCYSRNSTISI